MAIRHRIEGGVVWLAGAGVVTAEEASRALRALVSDAALGPKPRILCDLRLVTRLELDAASVRQLAELTAARDDVWVCPGLHYLRAVVEEIGRAHV